MAIHESVLLGAMSQSVDNLTMCVCRKLRIVRHKAKHVTNPRTDKQRVQRAKMKATIELAQAFAPTYSGAYPFTFRQPIKHKIAFKSTILYPFIP